MVKDLDEYLCKLEKKYSSVSKAEIKRILEYGFGVFYTLNKYGADIQIHNNNFTAYCGKMFIDDYKRTLYNNLKYRIKLRLNYKYTQEIYNGFYYFGLNEIEWEFYKKKLQSKRRSRIEFKNIKLFKIKEECFLDKSKKYFFILNYPIDIGWTCIKEKFKTRNFRYFAKRNIKNQVIEI